MSGTLDPVLETESASRLAARRFRQLWEIVSRTEAGSGEQFTEVLTAATRSLDLELGIISRIEGDSYTVEYCAGENLEPGMKFPLGKTYCAITFEADDVVLIDHMGDSKHKGHPCYSEFGLETYVGLPLRVSGERYGTLNFSSSVHRSHPWPEEDREYLSLLGSWVSSMLERRIALEILEAMNEELTRSNRELELFAATISHDLQAPLRTAASFAKLLVEHQGCGDATTTEFADFVTSSLGTAQNLVSGVLAYSRVQVADGSTDVDVDLQETCEVVITSLSAAMDECGATVLSRSLPVVRGNATQIRQLFMNLISNGLRHRLPERAPRIEVRAVETPEATLELHFEDNGKGIAPEHRDRVFEIFKRLDPESGDGCGLGLALSRRIAEHHGGDLQLESEEGKGSTFVVRLPAARIVELR